MEWSDETVLKLVRLYRSHPVLWDRKQREYKNRNARHDALLQIAVSLGKQKDEIERKIKNLLCHFSREIKKEKDSRKVDSLSHYNSKWFCYQSLLFLGARKKSKHAGIQRSNKTDVTTHPADQVLKPTFKDESEGDEQCHQFPSPKKTISDEATFTIREIREANPERDEYTLFGEQIAIKLRRLPTSHAKIMVQHIINTTLFEAEMGKYNGPAGTAYTVEYPTYVHDLHIRQRSSTCTNSTSPSGYTIVHSPYPTKHYPDPEVITGDKE